MWPLLLRFWKPVAGLAIILGAGWYCHHAGYESGRAASEAKWQGLFATAERARAEADEKARRKEEDSKVLSQESEARHAETVASLTLRAADAEQRTAGLVRQLAARSRCSPVPQASGSAALSNAASASDERLAGAAAQLTDAARRCESDARTLADLQRWVIEQRAIFNPPANPGP